MILNEADSMIFRVNQAEADAFLVMERAYLVT